MKCKRGVSLTVLLIVIMALLILLSTIVLNLSNVNPVDRARISRIYENQNDLKIDIDFYIANAEKETNSYFTKEEILFGTGNVRKSIDLSKVNNVGKNADGTWNASGYRIISKISSEYSKFYIRLNDNSVVKVYDIDKEQYEQLGNNFPKTTVNNCKWCIDENANVYLAFTNLQNIPKWIKGKVEDDGITDDATLSSFIGVIDDSYTETP